MVIIHSLSNCFQVAKFGWTQTEHVAQPETGENPVFSLARLHVTCACLRDNPDNHQLRIKPDFCVSSHRKKLFLDELTWQLKNGDFRSNFESSMS